MKGSASFLLGAARGGAQTETRELVGQLGSRPRCSSCTSSRPRRRVAARRRIHRAADAAAAFRRGRVEPGDRRHDAARRHDADPFGRSPTGELRGTLRGGVFKGARFAPGRARSASASSSARSSPRWTPTAPTVRCEPTGQYSSSSPCVVEAGKLQSLEWRSKVAPSGHTCSDREPAAGAVQGRAALRHRALQRDPARGRRLRAAGGRELHRAMRLAGVPRAPVHRPARATAGCCAPKKVQVAWEVVVGIETHAAPHSEQDLLRPPRPLSARRRTRRPPPSTSRCRACCRC